MKVCLILSGGGSNGVIQVGYCKYFHERGIEFSVITGTSTGALQGAMYAQEKYPDLENIWMSIKGKADIYKHHFPFSYIQGVFKKSLYSAKPLRQLIEKNVNEHLLIAAKQMFVSCSTNLSTMKQYYVASSEGNREIIKKFIYASSAFPMAFEPVAYNGSEFWDGGIVEPIPVKKAVQMQPDANLYIIGLTNPVYMPPKKPIGRTIFGYGMRAFESMFDEIWRNDISKGMRYWNDKKFVILQPPEPPFPSSLEWYPEITPQRIAQGYQIAKDLLHNKL